MRSYKKLIFLLVIFSLSFSVSHAQVYGCTDHEANNYNPAATNNDGSCVYPLTIFNPPVRFLLPDEVDETSGLAYINGKMWTINDSGGLPVLYAFDTISGEIVQRITVEGATNVDWESLADDDDYVYIGDFGNNSGNRDDLSIYRVKKSDIPLLGDGSVTSNKTTFVYVDYPGEVKKRSENNFDCEAFIATDDSLYLFSKNHKDQKTKMYKLPKIPGNYVAQIVTTFNSRGLVTGADINADGTEVTLVGYVDKEWTPFTWLLFDFKDNKFFSGNKRRIDLLNIIATQTEGVAYLHGGNEMITSEGRLFSQTAYNFNSYVWTNNGSLSVDEVDSDKFDFKLKPNPVTKGKLTLELIKLPVGEYHVNIHDMSGNLIKDIKYKVTKKDNVTKLKIKVGGFADGTYLLTMSSGKQVVEKKFIVR